MKKLILILSIFISISANSQTIKNWFMARDYYRLGDSTITGWYQGVLPDTNKVNTQILAALDTTTASIDSFFVSGQDLWVSNGDTIYKVDTATHALNSLDSIFGSLTADSIITKKIKSPVDSLLIQSGHGYTKFIPNSSSNYNWKIFPDSIVNYNTYTYNDRLAFISEVSSAGGSSGDIQYNNSGSLDGAPINTDGTDITIENTLNFTGTTVTEIDSNSVTTDTSVVNTYLDVNGNSDLNGILFTGSTKTNGSFYTGTSSPTNTFRLNFDGRLYAEGYYGKISSTLLGTGTPILATNAASTDVTYSAIRANAYDSYGYGITIDNGALNGGSVGVRPMFFINRNRTSVSGNITYDLISILDNPSASGTISGKVLTATIENTERIRLYPRSSTIDTAYIFDTDSLLTTTGAVLSVRNQGNEVFRVDSSGISINGGGTLPTSDAIDLKTAVESETFDLINVDTFIFGDGTKQISSSGLDTTVLYSASNMNDGDSITLLPAPGSGYAYAIKHITIVYSYNSIAFTGTGNNFVHWYSLGVDVTPIVVGVNKYTDTYSWVTSNFNISSTYPIDENSPIWFIFDDNLATGNGSGKILITYKIIDL
jgi:hypothetical protein